MNRILVIRGGAIGDFILTLPALKALRNAYPNALIEILGYRHIAALVEKRFYADFVRSIEYGSLSSFFARNAELPGDLKDYFAKFELIISYLYDPDKIFAANLRRSGVEQLIEGPARIDNSQHAARQLLRPLNQLGISVTDLEASVFPSASDRQFASEFLTDLPSPVVAIHPGSGSEQKNWPLENWLELGHDLLARNSLVVVSGEADRIQSAKLREEVGERRVRFAENLPLPQLAAILRQTVFVGHDSGISHLAAAAGAECILLFGPTDPEIWAPLNHNVRLIRAPENDLHLLELVPVREAVDHALMRIGMIT